VVEKQQKQQADFRKFTIYVKEEEEGGFSGQCAEIPGAISQGETLEELEGNMRDAIQLILESIKQEKEEANKRKIVIEVQA
jgi:predicted RNase H-like HicB family nuclease